VFETYGADAWYERAVEEFVPAGLSCPLLRGTSFEREMNISMCGSTPARVMKRCCLSGLSSRGCDLTSRAAISTRLVPELAARRPRHPRPSSLRQVVTHGFIVADDGRKM